MADRSNGFCPRRADSHGLSRPPYRRRERSPSSARRRTPR